MLLFPVKKIRKHFKVLVLAVILGLGVWAAYLEFVASSEWRRSGASSRYREPSNWREQSYRQRNKVPGVNRDLEYYNQRKDDRVNELVGQANLHVFEDWCGSSVDQLRKNVHFPLFPHTRTVVKRLAVAPRWTNYGLRIFGYIHPYAESEFQFAVASDDNSEFWLSTDDSPSNATLMAGVGKTGKEWTAPGEFGKFRSQISKPVLLSSSRKYYFEILHKQNSQGTDHVEVSWRLHNTGLKFNIIDSQYISLYINESLIKLNEVRHIPQSAASSKRNYHYLHSQDEHPAEMLKHDPRDSFFHLPLIAESHVHGLLPDCAYKPSYVIKGFPLQRYQGLQFVHLTYVYPNDYTRLTHMESENKCFYFENVYYLERFGFYRYMKMDMPPQKPNMEKFRNSLWMGVVDGNPKEQKRQEKEVLDRNFEKEEEEYYEGDGQFLDPQDPKAALQEQNQKNIEEVGSQKEQADRVQEAKHIPDRVNAADVNDYGDDYDDYTLNRKRKLFFVIENKPTNDTFEDNPGVDHRSAENVEALKGVRRKRSYISSVKENIQSILSANQKTNRTFQSFSKQKYASLKDRLVDPTVKSSEKQKPEGNSLSAPQISQGEKLGVNQNIGDLEFQERQAHGLMEKQKETVIQEAKKTIYDQQPPTLSTQKVNKNVAASISKMDSKKRIDYLKQRELQLPSKLKEGTFNADKQIPIADYSLFGQNSKLNNHAQNPRPSISMDIQSRKDVKLIKIKHQYEKVTSFNPDQKWKEKEYDYVEKENDAVTQKSQAKVKDNIKVIINRSRKWRHQDISMKGEEEEDGDDDEDFPDDVSFHKQVYDKAVNWDQTFSVNNMDFHSLRSDWIDLHCNVSGNLLMRDQEALDVVKMYMRKLNEKHKGIYSLHKIVNIEKRLDSLRGSRYLLELELLLNQKTIVRLSEYIYNLNGNSYHNGDERRMKNIYQQRGQNFRENQEKIFLCAPIGFSWQRNAMIHFIIPVKNQARWVQQFIFDMEELYAVTGDEYFNVIIADYSSTDMDVEKALKHSMLTRYQYVRLEGNFERSAGLQSGIDLIQKRTARGYTDRQTYFTDPEGKLGFVTATPTKSSEEIQQFLLQTEINNILQYLHLENIDAVHFKLDDHSIVFLCDLHIYFPPNIIDSIRKHCVEGKMAFAPLVIRLNCGSSPQEPDGYWEVNGFGLLGIYKSDLDKIGGMNTKEFRDRWGGEDWELLDRIFQAGLEVERLYMRNFFHYYHSKRGMWNRKQIKVT